jgi:hypothetical protein
MRKMSMSKTQLSTKVRVTAYWGNDDAESSIELITDVWNEIQNGAEYSVTSESWYEGESESVTWLFNKGLVSIDGEDCRQCLVEETLSALIVEK